MMYSNKVAIGEVELLTKADDMHMSDGGMEDIAKQVISIICEFMGA